MKLLFDANLSPKLVRRLDALFPESSHVLHAGLEHSTPDELIWDYAKSNGFTIVTADSDFLQIVQSLGPPPRVVRLENCNYRTAQVEELLRRHAIRIAELENSPRSSLIIRD